MPMKFDAAWVRRWSDRYLNEEMADGVEADLLDSVGPSVAKRGWLTSAELLAIGRWKAVRVTTYLRRNDTETIRDVSGVALAKTTPDWMRHRVLTILEGVGHPMASAILTIWEPEHNTILDYRAVEALQELARLGLLGSAAPSGSRRRLPGYWAYLGLFAPVARRLRVTFRDLDRALWKWGREGMPTR